MCVWCGCFVLSGRGLCGELITRPEESYCGASLCDLETSWMRRPWPTGGCRAKYKQTVGPNYLFTFLLSTGYSYIAWTSATWNLIPGLISFEERLKHRLWTQQNSINIELKSIYTVFEHKLILRIFIVCVEFLSYKLANKLHMSKNLRAPWRWPTAQAETCRSNDLLTPWSRVFLEKLTGSQLVKKFPALYGTQRFITAFTSACHLSLSWDRSIQSMPPPPIPLPEDPS